jgi:hypothetical protein
MEEERKRSTDWKRQRLDGGREAMTGWRKRSTVRMKGDEGKDTRVELWKIENSIWKKYARSVG